jgi:hypothetical protein
MEKRAKKRKPAGENAHSGFVIYGWLKKLASFYNQGKTLAFKARKLRKRGRISTAKALFRQQEFEFVC